jgi:hypothetical protein
MLSPSSYIFGYQQGQHSAERDRWAQNFKERLAGRRPVTVDQSYIDGLQSAQRQAQVAADHNYATGKQWMDHAQHLERENAELKAENAQLVAVGEQGLAMLQELNGWRDSERSAALGELSSERLARREAADQMHLMVTFMSLLVDLAKAEKAGKTDHPDYQDLKLFAEEFPVRIASGERHVFFPKITGPGWTRLRKALES